MIALGSVDESEAEVPFTLPLASDPLTGLTGYAFTLGQARIRLPEAMAWIDVALLKIREIGYGRFAARLTAAQRLIAGPVAINVEVPDTQPYRGVEIVGTGSGDINEGEGGYAYFYLPQAPNPVYGPPITEHEFGPGEVRVAWVDEVYADADPDDVVEFGNGLYGLWVPPERAIRGKIYLYVSVDGAQRFEGYTTVLTASAFAAAPAEPPPLVETPIVHTSPLYVDHVTQAVNRLCQQFKADPWVSQ